MNHTQKLIAGCLVGLPIEMRIYCIGLGDESSPINPSSLTGLWKHCNFLKFRYFTIQFVIGNYCIDSIQIDDQKSNFKFRFKLAIHEKWLIWLTINNCFSQCVSKAKTFRFQWTILIVIFLSSSLTLEASIKNKGS